MEEEKETRSLGESLTNEMTIEEKKVMYAQHNQGRGHRGCGYDRSTYCGRGDNNEERGQTNQQNWGGQ